MAEGCQMCFRHYTLTGDLVEEVYLWPAYCIVKFTYYVRIKENIHSKLGPHQASVKFVIV